MNSVILGLNLLFGFMNLIIIVMTARLLITRRRKGAAR